MNRLDLLPEDVVILIWKCVFNEVLQELPKTSSTKSELDDHGAWYYGGCFYDSSSTEFDSDYD